MKFVSTFLFLVTLGLVSAEDKNDGKYPDWKTAAERAEKVVKSKHESVDALVKAMDLKDKTEAEREVTSAKSKLDLVVAQVKIITDLDEAEYKKAKDDKEKQAVATKAATAGVTLTTNLLEFETHYKKASYQHALKKAEKEGHVKFLDFLKGKVENLDKDNFFVSSVAAAIALSALAIGSTFN